LARAQSAGALRRNFQGYTTDPSDILLGFGASAIGRLAQGYVQNEVALGRYAARIASGELATAVMRPKKRDGNGRPCRQAARSDGSLS
jgi:oxygen-independent coproporphyrinogen-3 oxidase